MNDELDNPVNVSILSGATPAAAKKRGFACMDPAAVAELASRGGRAAQASGKAHRWTSEAARIAGHKGGTATRNNKRQASAE